MTPAVLLFYLFATVLLLAGLRVVTARNPVHAALFLVLAFFSAAALWLMIGAEFLAISLVLVYVGAVMVLFLFVVMMLNPSRESVRTGFWKNLPLAGMVAAAIAAEMVLVLVSPKTDLAGHALAPAAKSNVKELGRLIYTEYVYPFELASVVLLLAIVAAIALTMRPKKASRRMDPAVQVKAKKADRLVIVKMPAETQHGGEAS